MVPTVKHGGGSVLMWGCMSAAGVGELHFIDGIMNSQRYCSMLKKKMPPSHCALRRHALFQHDMTMRPLFDFWRRTGWKWFSVCQVCLLIWTQLNTYGEFWAKLFFLESGKRLMLQNVANLFIPCFEDLVLSLQIMEAIQSTRCTVFVVVCSHFCITLISAKLKNV